MRGTKGRRKTHQEKQPGFNLHTGNNRNNILYKKQDDTMKKRQKYGL